MYTLIDNLFSFGSIGLFIYGCIDRDYRKILGGMAAYVFYPIITELGLNLITRIIHSDKSFQQNHVQKHLDSKKGFAGQKLPIVFHTRYNITAGGIEKWHPFDSTKYQRIYDQLIERNFPNCTYFSFVIVQKLQKSQRYLYENMSEISKWRVLNPQLYATQGTIDACCLAMDKKWAINLAGGYHHAHLNDGGGFCIFPDITLGVGQKGDARRSRCPSVIFTNKGNGHELDFKNMKDQVHIIDFFNPHIYPHDTDAKDGITTTQHVFYSDHDEIYLKMMKNQIEEKIEEFKPDFVFYNAGTDSMDNDPLGDLSLSAECIIKRDQYMFEMCLKRDIPIVMVLSGGYQQINAPTIANSIQNLLLNVIRIKDYKVE